MLDRDNAIDKTVMKWIGFSHFITLLFGMAFGAVLTCFAMFNDYSLLFVLICIILCLLIAIICRIIFMHNWKNCKLKCR